MIEEELSVLRQQSPFSPPSLISGTPSTHSSTTLSDEQEYDSLSDIIANLRIDSDSGDINGQPTQSQEEELDAEEVEDDEELPQLIEGDVQQLDVADLQIAVTSQLYDAPELEPEQQDLQIHIVEPVRKQEEETLYGNQEDQEEDQDQDQDQDQADVAMQTEECIELMIANEEVAEEVEEVEGQQGQQQQIVAADQQTLIMINMFRQIEEANIRRDEQHTQQLQTMTQHFRQHAQRSEQMIGHLSGQVNSLQQQVHKLRVSNGKLQRQVSELTNINKEQAGKLENQQKQIKLLTDDLKSKSAQMHRTAKRSTIKKAVIGGTAGAYIGGHIGSVACFPCPPAGIAVGIVVGGAAGAGLGALF